MRPNSIALMGRRRGCSVVDVGGVRVSAGDDVDGDGVVFGSNVVDEGSVVVGSEPWWNLSTWEQTAKETRSLRTQIQRAKNKGVTATQPSTANAAGVKALVEGWLRTRTMAPMGFVVDVDQGDVVGADVVVVAEQAGVVRGVAAANVFDGNDAALVEFVLVDKDAANGTGEFLVDAVFRALAERGVAAATLGLAPLRDDPAAPLPRWLRVARDLTGGLFDWRGLTSWKEKLKPTSWAPVTLRTRGVHPLVGVVLVLLAFARKRPVRFALQTLLRGPPLFFRAVAAALLPWTLALALVDDRHFPNRVVHLSWVVFDVALAALLFWLAFRIKRRKQRMTLHRALAVVVGVDALVTCAQALSWNVPRAAHAVDVVVLVVGVLAPLLVDVVLWTSLRHRR